MLSDTQKKSIYEICHRLVIFKNQLPYSEKIQLKSLNINKPDDNLLFIRAAVSCLEEILPEEPEKRNHQKTLWAFILKYLAQTDKFEKPEGHLAQQCAQAAISPELFYSMLNRTGTDLIHTMHTISQKALAKNVLLNIFDIAYLLYYEDDDNKRMLSEIFTAKSNN